MDEKKWAADNVAFGSGGALLQKLNRDTQKFAFKCCHIKADGKDVDVFKDPITDPGKKSPPTPYPLSAFKSSDRNAVRSCITALIEVGDSRSRTDYSTGARHVERIPYGAEEPPTANSLRGVRELHTTPTKIGRTL